MYFNIMKVIACKTKKNFNNSLLLKEIHYHIELKLKQPGMKYSTAEK